MGEKKPSRNGRRPLFRDDPARTDPIRNWSGIYRRADSGGARSPQEEIQSEDQTVHQDRLWTDIVSDSVKLGYRVVEEQLRQGRRVAKQVNDRSYDVGAMGNDLQGLVGRLAQYYTDLGSLWGDLINVLMANPDFLNNLLRVLQPQPAPDKETQADGKPATEASSRESVSISIELTSPRPTQVTLDVRPYSEHATLVTHGLHAADPGKRPLTAIAFEPDLETRSLLLRIHVPDEQPSGVYTGVIVDKHTNSPRGTLSVRIAM